MVKDNIHIQNWSNIPKILTTSVGTGAAEKYTFYRPVQTFSYLIDYSLWKLNTTGYHLSNILLHIFVALTIFWLANILSGDWLLSLFAGTLFVIHPLHTEAVCYISGRSDSLSVLFILLCFILYIKYIRFKTATFFVFFILAFILALLSREVSLILPAILLLYHYTFRKKLKLLPFLSVLTISFVYILLRVTLLKHILANATLTHSTLLQRTPGFFVAITSYLKLLFLPFHLHMEYGGKLFNWIDPKSMLGIIIVFSLLIYGFRKRKTNKLVFFSICWFFITLLPMSNLYPINAYMAEHWLYLPSIGFFLISALGLRYIFRSKNFRIFTIIFTIVLLVFYSCLTIKQNSYWKEPLVFFKRTLQYAPDSSRAHYHLACVYVQNNQNEKAIASYKKAIELNPDYSAVYYAYYNLGCAYQTLNKNEEAITSYKKAIELNPGLAKTYNNLGSAYRAINKNEEAITSFKKALEINPSYAKASYNLGCVYQATNKQREAITSYKKAIASNPGEIKYYNNLAAAYYDNGQIKEAIALLEKTIDDNPDATFLYHNLEKMYETIGNDNTGLDSALPYDVMEKEETKSYKQISNAPDDSFIDKNAEKTTDSFFQAGIHYGKEGKHTEAIEEFKKAIKADANFILAYINLGNAYMQKGSIDQAIEIYKKTIEINPGIDSSMAYLNLGAIYANIKKDYSEAIKYLEKYVELNQGTQESEVIEKQIHTLIYYMLQSEKK